MKRFLLGLLAVLALCMAAAAHPGKTDSRGGHYNRSTGEYHYHHGYPAHQHIDGTCPYDFDDKTGGNSGGSGGGKTSETPSVSKPVEAGEVKSEPEDTDGSLWWMLGLIAVWAVPTAAQMASDVHANKKLRKAEEEALAKDREDFRLRYEGKSLKEAVGVPPAYEMDENGMPHTAGCAGSKKDVFTVYVTQSGSSYHSAQCRYAKTGRPVNLCAAVRLGKRACTRCRPMQSVPEWVGAYATLDRLRKRYQVDMLP